MSTLNCFEVYLTLANIAAAHGENLANTIPALNIVQPETNPYASIPSLRVDISDLVRQRFKHQTKQGLTGVRKFGSTESISRNLTKPLSEGQHLRKFNEIIKQQDDRGIGTGLERKGRWKANGILANTAMSENPANAAAAVAGAAASKVSSCLVTTA